MSPNFTLIAVALVWFATGLMIGWGLEQIITQHNFHALEGNP